MFAGASGFVEAEEGFVTVKWSSASLFLNTCVLSLSSAVDLSSYSGSSVASGSGESNLGRKQSWGAEL